MSLTKKFFAAALFGTLLGTFGAASASAQTQTGHHTEASACVDLLSQHKLHDYPASQIAIVNSPTHGAVYGMPVGAGGSYYLKECFDLTNTRDANRFHNIVTRAANAETRAYNQEQARARANQRSALQEANRTLNQTRQVIDGVGRNVNSIRRLERILRR